jgi:hypothetical protein
MLLQCQAMRNIDIHNITIINRSGFTDTSFTSINQYCFDISKNNVMIGLVNKLEVTIGTSSLFKLASTL